MSILKYFIFIIFSSLSLSFIFTCNASDNLLLDLHNSIESKNTELFFQSVRRLKILQVNYLLNGQTPLTFLIKEINFLKHVNLSERNKKVLNKRFLEFFVKVLPYMQKFLNIKDVDGYFPLELALKCENLDFSAELIKSGANISIVNSNLLEEKLVSMNLIGKLIRDYISYYLVFLSSLRKDNFFEICQKSNLEGIVGIYFSKCRLNNLEEKVCLLELINSGKSRIQSAINKKSNRFRKKFMPKAYYHAQEIFGDEIDTLRDNNLCELDLNKFIDKCFSKIYRHVKYARKNTDQVFFNNLLAKKNNNNFIDLHVKCKN
ncbi:MAG: hypothetical protein UR12_C0001G0021 [candidate division TM6 bacterium GW2011_GWF2_30_66]|nr:MAG: hypothetical protein UR12_C0001G0021 [candidate division TM6 bacterium GW2011_GWF2_30_66]